MEKTNRAAVCAVSYEWNDLGTWSAIHDTHQKDANGNALSGDSVVLDSHNNLVHSESSLTTLLGVEDLIVVNTRDALLVANKDKSEDIKTLYEQLKNDGRKETTEAMRMFRPWGSYERIDFGPGYQVKRIVVNPGGVLSLQTHKFRSEHWVVVQGFAEVTIGDDVSTLGPNQSTYVQAGVKHRLANRTEEPVTLIEVQTGEYLGEDDIIRIEDHYNRSSQPKRTD